MSIVFYSLIFISTKSFLVSSITLDIHYPEDVVAEECYGQFHPYRSIQAFNPDESEYACQPCQCSYPFPPETVYYPPTVYRSSPTPTQPPVSTPPSPPIFSQGASFTPVQLTPNIQTTQDETKYKSEDFARSHTQTQQLSDQLVPNVQTIQDETKYKSVDYSQSHTQTQPLSVQLGPNVQTIQDETKYKSVDYAQSHSQTQQIHRLPMRRSSQQPDYAIVQSPINYQEPQQPNIYRYLRSVIPSDWSAHHVYNVNGSPRTNVNRATRSVSSRGRDFGSALESSKVQNGNDVATQSSIMTPEYSPSSPININNGRNKHSTHLDSLAWAHGVIEDNYFAYNPQRNTTASIREESTKNTSNPTQYNDVVPSTKLVTSLVALNSLDNPRETDDNPFFNFNSNGGATEPFSDTKQDGRIYHPTVHQDPSVYQVHTRQHRPLPELVEVFTIPIGP